MLGDNIHCYVGKSPSGLTSFNVVVLPLVRGLPQRGEDTRMPLLSQGPSRYHGLLVAAGL